MKRLFCILFVLLVCFSLTACGDTTPAFVDRSIERSCAEPSWAGKTYSWETLTNQAVCVVEADVTAVQHDDNGTAFTVLDVRKTLKGDSENILVVRDTAWSYDADGSVSAERSLCGDR